MDRLTTFAGARVRPLSLLGQWEALGRPLRMLGKVPALIALLLALAALGYSAVSTQHFDQVKQARAADLAKKRAAGRQGDLALYQRINARVAAGENYYTVATDEQRRNHYPTRPFVTVRTPTMALSAAVLGMRGWHWLGLILLAGTAGAWLSKLWDRTLALEKAAVFGLVIAAGWHATLPLIGLKHDIVAGLLLSLAFALHRPDRWWPSWIAVALALAVRELAFPFVLVWAMVTLVDRRWGEFRAVLALIVLFVVGYTLHAWAVQAAQLPNDPMSPGWTERLGLPLVWGSLADVTPMRPWPAWLTGPLALLPLLGWLGLGGRTGLFGLLYYGGMTVAIAIFARANTFYWVMVMLPAYFVGLALAPRALADLALAVLGRPARQRWGLVGQRLSEV